MTPIPCPSPAILAASAVLLACATTPAQVLPEIKVHFPIGKSARSVYARLFEVEKDGTGRMRLAEEYREGQFGITFTSSREGGGVRAASVREVGTSYVATAHFEFLHENLSDALGTFASIGQVQPQNSRSVALGYDEYTASLVAYATFNDDPVGTPVFLPDAREAIVRWTQDEMSLLIEVKQPAGAWSPVVFLESQNAGPYRYTLECGGLGPESSVALARLDLSGDIVNSAEGDVLECIAEMDESTYDALVAISASQITTARESIEVIEATLDSLLPSLRADLRSDTFPERRTATSTYRNLRRVRREVRRALKELGTSRTGSASLDRAWEYLDLASGGMRGLAYTRPEHRALQVARPL